MKKTIYTLIAILGFVNLIMAQLPSYVPTSGLVAWYPINGTGIDLSSNNYNLDSLGTILPDTNRFGVSNKAKYFGSISNNIDNNRYNLPSSAMSAFNNLSAGTISFWVKIKQWNVTNHYFGFDNGFIIKQKNGVNTQIQIGIKGGTSKIRFHLNGGLPASSTFESNTSLNLNQWYNITVSWNGTYQFIYINGVLDNTILSSQTLTNMVSPDWFAIGSYFVGSSIGGSFAVISDVGFWTRSLTTNEVSGLYQICSNDTITTQPTNQVGNKGSNKTFSFAHSGTGNSYQWQSNAAVLGWQNVPNVSSYTGATTNSLTVNNLTVSNHNQLFRVVTSKTGCKDTSNTVSLTLANIATDSLRSLRLQADSSRLTNESVIYLARINKLMNDSAYYTSRILKLSNDSVFYVNRIAKLTNDSVYYTGRITKLISDSNMFVSRINKLSNDSIYYLSRINKLSNDSVYYNGRITKLIIDSNVFVTRINKLSYDSVINLGRITKLSNDSVYYNGRITKLISDSNMFVSRINKLSNDSFNYLSRINKLSNDSIYYIGRITKLISDSNAFVARINKLSYDSVINLGRITNLKIDSINNKTTISLLNADIAAKGNIITFLQLDSTNKGIAIRQLQTDLANKHDTVYIASVITSDTLRIAIRTGISSTSPIINSLKVYPNPASTLLNIDLEKPGYFIAKLSSITGQTIIKPTSGTIDVSTLANGVYILTIYDSNNKLISTNKIAIVK